MKGKIATSDCGKLSVETAQRTLRSLAGP